MSLIATTCVWRIVDSARINQQFAKHRLMNELLEGHIRTHLIDAQQRPTPEQIQAAEDLLDLVKA